jgi:aryl-alcohol dehydrogenase-like predicted oxidoreductase
MNDPPRGVGVDYKVLRQAGKRKGVRDMQRRTVGTSGLVVSAVGLGCNNFGGRLDLAQTRAVVHKALDLGITLFDTADVYGGGGGSERMLGEILGPRRRDVVLATKFGAQLDDAGRRAGASRRSVMAAVDASLTRLNTTWIDLYQLHWPDPATPIEETLRALDDLVRQGKVRCVGSSNMDGRQIIEAHQVARDHDLQRFVSAQNEYSLLNRTAERDAIRAMEACGIGLIPYFPLASGLLTGKYRRDAIPAGTRLASPRAHEAVFREHAGWALIDTLDRFARARGRTLLELAFGWLLSRPVTASVIAGATSPAQVEQNVRAAGWMLTAEEHADVDRLTDCT